MNSHSVPTVLNFSSSAGQRRMATRTTTAAAPSSPPSRTRTTCPAWAAAAAPASSTRWSGSAASSRRRRTRSAAGRRRTRGATSSAGARPTGATRAGGAAARPAGRPWGRGPPSCSPAESWTEVFFYGEWWCSLNEGFLCDWFRFIMSLDKKKKDQISRENKPMAYPITPSGDFWVPVPVRSCLQLQGKQEKLGYAQMQEGFLSSSLDPAKETG